MAVTRTNRTIHLTAATDAVTGKVLVQGIVADAAATLTDTAGTVVFKSGGAESMVFPAGLPLEGLIYSVGTGTVTVYIL